MREAGSTAVQEIAFTFADGDRVRRSCDRGRTRRRRLRAAALVLLGLPQQLLRRGREVPRRPTAVGAHHARPLRREGPELAEAPVPHADGRRDADRATTREQRRARRVSGDGGGARRARSRCTPTRWTRRSGFPTDQSRATRAADAADPRLRDRRRRHRRSARWLVLRRDRSPPRSRREPRPCCRRCSTAAAPSSRSRG